MISEIVEQTIETEQHRIYYKLETFSVYIHQNPEISFQEKEAHKALTKLLQEEDVEVSQGIIELPASFKASVVCHRHQEFIRFLKQIDGETPFGLDLHLIVDNYGTHKHPRVKSWLKRHPRFHLHFTPTSSSWLNLVERWFREITDKRIRRGSFQNVSALIKAIK